MRYISGLVSVIIPTYKRSNMLSRAIDSVLEQSYKNIELLIINDNEKNDEYSKELYSIINKYKDNRLLFLEQKKHINGAVARNYGLKHAKGEFIAFLDDDDWWEPTKIEKQVTVLSKLDSSWGAVSCLKQYHNGDKIYRASKPYKDGYVFENVVYFMTNITTGTILMRRTALDDTGYFDENLKRQQDVQLFSFFTKKYKIKLLYKYLLNIDLSDSQNRISSNGIDEIKNAYVESIMPIIKDDKKILKNLLVHNKFTKGIFLLKEKNFKGIFLVLSTIKKPKVFFAECRYYYNNWLEVFLCKKYLQKYK